MSPEVIAFSSVSKTYLMGGQTINALDAVSLAIRAGEYVAIIGPSGSGKSTMMNVIGCLDVPSSGVYQLSGVDVGGMSETELADIRNRRIGFVFQSFHLLPRLSAYENVELPLIYRGLNNQERRERVEAKLQAVGLADRAAHRPNELSGGQRQRVAIARALVTEPEILLADEPTGNLDQKTGIEILELLDQVHQSGQTIVLVTHDPEVAARADRVIALRDGVIERDQPAGSFEWH